MKNVTRTAVVALLALAVAPSAATAQKAYAIKIESVPTGAAVYLEAREAGVQGYTPHSFKLRRGSYTLILEAKDHEPLTRTIQVTKAQTFKFTLVPAARPAVLSVSAAEGADALGGEVKINGKPVGTVPVKVSLQPGRYLLEVSKPGYDGFQQWLDIKKGVDQEVTITLSKTRSKTAGLLVSSNVHAAEVYLDGRRQPEAAPALLQDVKPGKHVVELRAKGYLSAQKEVEAKAGETVKVELLLQRDPRTLAAETGTLMILSSEPESEIRVDGKVQGKAPIKVQGLVPGSHLVEAHKEGFKPAEQTVEVAKGEFKTIKLKLELPPPPRKTGAVRVISPPVRGALVFIDGTLAGKTPFLRHQLDPGPHFVTVRMAGYEEQIQTVDVKAGQIVEVKVQLVKAGEAGAPASAPASAPTEGAEEEEPVTSSMGLSSFGAHLVPPSYFTGDVSLGFPHIFEGRLTAGLFSKGNFGLDGGVEFRTYGAMSEIGIHTKLRLLRRDPFAVGVLFAFGGGGGPSYRNTIYANLGVVASMWFKKLVTFSARAYFNFYSDRHCPGDRESDELDPLCRSPSAAGVDGLDAGDMRDRFSGTRFLLQAALEVPIHKRVNLFGIFEGAPFQGNRRAFTDAFAGVMPDEDPAVYGRVGATFKY